MAGSDHPHSWRLPACAGAVPLRPGVQASGVFDLRVGRVARRQPGSSTLTSEQRRHVMAIAFSSVSRTLRLTLTLSMAAGVFLVSADDRVGTGTARARCPGIWLSACARGPAGGKCHRHGHRSAGEWHWRRVTGCASRSAWQRERSSKCPRARWRRWPTIPSADQLSSNHVVSAQMDRDQPVHRGGPGS